MSIRLLLGVLTPILSDYSNERALEEVDTSDEVLQIDIQTQAKFHIGMLSISLIAGLAFGGFITYKTWKERNIFLGYIRNLVIALVCRTFFSILFDGVIFLGTLLDVAGGNTLQAFEQIFINLVLAFWLTLTIYMNARVRTNFNSEPTLRLYQYGIPGVAVFFALVWIFTWQSQMPSRVWGLYFIPFAQWIVNSINLLFLLIQLALVGDIVKMMMKMSLDNDSVSLLRIITIMMGALILIFWLQFGFVQGKFPLSSSPTYIYFCYFIDGLECALVCLVLYFFSKRVYILLNKISSLMILQEETPTRTSKRSEVLLTGHDDRRVVTIDSVFMTSESERWKVLEEEGTKDVVYSNVVEPQRLKKTLELYKRFDIIPTDRVTVVEGEEFYDCQVQSSLEFNEFEKNKLSPKQLASLQVSKHIATSDIVREQTQKKNAFYSSKYLILDSKENNFPKYLETRPSVSSISGEDNLKEARLKKDFPSSLDCLISEELVRQWLFDNSENMPKNEKNKTGNRRISEKENRKISKDENLDLEMPKHESSSETTVKTEGAPRLNQVIMPQTIVTTIGSVLSNTLFRSSKSERRNPDKEKSEVPAPKEIKAAVSEQNDAKKFVETVHQLKHEITESQKKNDISDDALINTDKNMRPREKVDTLTTLKENEKFHSETQTKVIKTSEDVSNKFPHNLKSETKENPKEFKKKTVNSAEEQKRNQANDTELTLSYENNLVQFTYPESLEFRSRQHQLKTEELPQVSKKELEKLTGFLLENQHHNNSAFETENENICGTLSENESKEPESLEPQIRSATCAYKEENSETNEDIIRKPLRDLKFGPEVPLSETVMESIPIDSIKELPKSTALTPLDVQNSKKPMEPLSQYITYSELLNFRSQRDKETVNQSSFSFSEAISLAIDSLINVGGGFFFSGKNYPDKEKLQNVEGRETEKSDTNLETNHYRAPHNVINEKLGDVQRPENQHQNITHKIPKSEAKNESIYDSQSLKNKAEEPELLEPQIQNLTIACKIEDERTQVLNEVLHSSESELKLSVPDFKKRKDISMTTDMLKEKPTNFEKDISPLSKEFNFSQPLEYQSQRDELATAQLSKDAENDKVFDNSFEMELQSKTFEIIKGTSNLINKSEDDTEKHNQTYKTEEQKSFGLSVLTELDVNAKQIQKPHVEQPEQSQVKSYRAGISLPPDNETGMNEVSSDSEFSIKK